MSKSREIGQILNREVVCEFGKRVPVNSCAVTCCIQVCQLIFM